VQGGTACDADTDRGHLARRAPLVGRYPHPAAPLDLPGAGQPDLGAHVDQQPLDPAHVRDHVHRFGEAQDRVADELPRPVPGDLSAPVDVDDLGAVDRPVPRLRTLAGRVDGRVLQQQYGRRRGAVGHRLVQPALLGQRGPVVDKAEPDGERGNLHRTGHIQQHSHA
jgi:hypothetical protein